MSHAAQSLIEHHLTGRIPDKQGRITHLEVDHARIYRVDEIMKWIKDGIYSFSTVAEEGPTPVYVRGKKFMTTKGNTTKEDNLDYLPVPRLA